MNALGHYFRNLYHIFKYIHLSGQTIEERKFYATIVRAQLSSDELYLLLYNSLIPRLGNPKFLYLMKTYDILQNFNKNLINAFDLEIYHVTEKNVADPFGVD